jgi:hypothetical protein
MYIAEVAPSNLRGTLVSWNQFAIIFGQLVVYFVNFLILGDHIAPAIEKITELFVRATEAVSQFFAALTGSGYYYRAKRNMTEYGH